MPPAPIPPLELTLVLAATRDMGIGLNGGLPWTGLKKEMAYFARITKRLPPPPPHAENNTAVSPPPLVNAVIMGRKTWDSIPPRFRPLKGRLNIVISRSASTPAAVAEKRDEGEGEGVVMAPSLEQALSYLGGRRGGGGDGGNGNVGGVGRIFVIGGGQIYGAALKLKETKRILLTRVLSDFECDTFFPLVLGDGGVSSAGAGAAEKEEQRPKEVVADADGWTQTSKERFDEWAGEEVPGGIQEENGTQYEFQMWERSGDS